MKINWSRARRLALAGIVVALAASAPGPRLAAQDATGALIVGGDSPDLFLLYTGDVIGYVDPCG